MTPAKRRAATLLASLTLATAAVGGNVAAQSAAPAAGGTLVIGEWQARQPADAAVQQRVR